MEQEEKHKDSRLATIRQSLPQSQFDIIDNLSVKDKLEIFKEIAKSSNTGVTDAAQALLIYQKARELGIGWANAIPHMHIIRGKAGIDIHIVKAILSRPSSGVTWECIEDYTSIFRYTDGNMIFIGKDTLPPEAQIVSKLADLVESGKRAFVILPEEVKDNKPVFKAYDYRTKYVFTRKKKHIDGKYIEVKSFKGVFSWRDALTAGLPYNKAGELDPNSAWTAYRKLMVDIRAFTFGARDIASDLLMGCYETTELYDINSLNYNVTEEGVAEIV